MNLRETLQRNLIYLVVFSTGACVLIIEVIATRILNPYYGNTIYSYSSILGVILAGLSIGYYYGGILADKRPEKKLFYIIILLAGLSVFNVHLMKLTILPYLESSFNIKSGPFLFSIILFFLPAVLLGFLSPFAIKIQNINYPKLGVGTISGRVFFSSTVGSILGSFIAGFYLIPNYGLNHILLGVAIFLVLIGFLGSTQFDNSRISSKMILIGLLYASLLLSIIRHEDSNFIYSADGVYQKIYFRDAVINGKMAKLLMLDANPSAAKYYRHPELAFDYTKYYELYQFFNPSAKNFLFIGGGGYNMPIALAQSRPDSIVDVVEVEPELYEIAKKQYDHPDLENLNNYIGDGRSYLRLSDSYDMIITDAYSSLYSIPSHLTTQEFFQLGYDRLNDGGIFMAYIIGKLDDSQPVFALSEYKTFIEVFENNYILAVDDPFTKRAQNLLFIGYKSDKVIDLNDKQINSGKINLSDHIIDMKDFDMSNQILLTDNYAPVEMLNEAMYGEI